MKEQLITKRDQALKEIDTMRSLLTTEKRSVFNADEKAKFETLKNEITGLADQIEAERFLESQKKTEERAEVKLMFEKTAVEQKSNSDYSIARALRALIEGKPLEGREKEVDADLDKLLKAKDQSRNSPNAILVPGSELRGLLIEKRTTNNLTNTTALVQQNLATNIDQIQYPVLYTQIANVIKVGRGTALVPRIDNWIGSYAPTDSSASDGTFTANNVAIAPKWMQIAVAFGKDLLASATDDLLNQVAGKMAYGLDRATDKKMTDDVYSASTAQKYVTTGQTRTYMGYLDLINAIPYKSAILTSNRSKTFLQTTPTISGSSTNALPIWNYNDQIAGVPAYSSFDASNTLFAVGNFRDSYTICQWDDIYSILIDPFTEARKGNLVIQFSRLQNQAVTNPKAFAVSQVSKYI